MSDDDESGLFGKVVASLFVIPILELFGLMIYVGTTDPAALDALTAGGIAPMELVRFLTASPDRLLVAVGLALLGVFFGFTGGSGGNHHPVGP